MKQSWLIGLTPIILSIRYTADKLCLVDSCKHGLTRCEFNQWQDNTAILIYHGYYKTLMENQIHFQNYIDLHSSCWVMNLILQVRKIKEPKQR